MSCFEPVCLPLAFVQRSDAAGSLTLELESVGQQSLAGHLKRPMSCMTLLVMPRESDLRSV